MKQLEGDLPHHVPIRKENRWEPIQHYATAPNTGIAAIPVRRPGISDLLMPERQESVSSYISQYSSQTRQQRLSNRSIATSISREDDDRQRLSNRSIATSISREDDDDTSIATPFSQSKQRNGMLSEYMSNPLLPQYHSPEANEYARLDEWFQHSDNSSLSPKESSITKPNSGRSMIPIVHEFNSTSGSKSTSDSKSTGETHTVSESETISDNSILSADIYQDQSSSSPTPNRIIITQESVQRVLRESAPHSVSSDQQTMGSDTTSSTKLDRLREKMKRLREKNHQQILQSRFQLQRTTQSPSRVASNENPAATSTPSLQRTDSFSQATATSNTKGKRHNLSRTDSFSQSPVIYWQRLERRKQARKPKVYSVKEPFPSDISLLMTDSVSQSPTIYWQRLERRKQARKPKLNSVNEENPVEIESKGTKSNLKMEVKTDSSPRKTQKSFAPHSSFSSFGCTSIAEEEEDTQSENDYDPAFDPDIDIVSSFDSSKQAVENDLEEDLFINSSFDSSKCSSIAEQAVQEERLHIDSSFDSSKCSSIAEDAVQSLRSERLRMNSSFDSSKCKSITWEDTESLRDEVREERQYDPSIHITRHYSMGRKAKKPTKRSSKTSETVPSTPLQQKLERRGRRSKSTRSLTASEESPLPENGTSPEAKKLAQELKEALVARGPPIEAEEVRKRPWCDPFQSDGILPLASEDSLSVSLQTTPQSFREKRNAYLNSVGDTNESRRQSPFTTANWVLGKLPDKPPILDPIVREEREHGEESAAKACLGRPRNRKSRENGSMEDAGQVSPKRLLDKNLGNKGRNLRSRREPPIRETGGGDPSHKNWAQCSFVNQIRTTPKPKESNGNKTSPTRKLVRSKSSRKNEENTNNTSLRRLVRNSSKSSLGKERDEPPKMPSSERLISSKQDTSTESPTRMVRSKSSKEKEKESIKNAISRRPTRRNTTSQSSLDQSGERNMSKLTQELLRTSNNSLMDGKRPSSKRLARNNRKLPVDVEGESSSKKPIRKNSISAADRGRDSSSKSDSSSRKILRSPSQSPHNTRDRSCKSYDAMDNVLSNASSTQKTSSWRAAKKRDSGINDEKTPQKPSSGRFGSGFRNSLGTPKKFSSGWFGALSKTKEEKAPTKPTSGRFGAILSKLSSDKGDGKKKKAKRISFEGVAKRISFESAKTKRISYESVNDLSEDEDWLDLFPLDLIPKSEMPSASRSLRSSSQFEPSASRGSLTRKPSSGKLLGGTSKNLDFDRRDDSPQSVSKSDKVKRPSSWRESTARSVGRNHSHLSNTATTVNTDPSSNDSSSTGSSDSDSSPEENTVVCTKNNDLTSPKHGRRTRPRRNTSHRSAMRRLRRYKDYRKNGVIVGEQKRFHVDMTGGMQ